MSWLSTRAAANMSTAVNPAKVMRTTSSPHLPYKNNKSMDHLLHEKVVSKEEKDNENSDELSVHVRNAPSIAGHSMLEIELKVHPKSKHTSIFKRRSECRDLMDLFRIVGTMSPKAFTCLVCRTSSKLVTSTMYRCGSSCNLEAHVFHDFLVYVMQQFKCMDASTLSECSLHMGAVRMVMEFLSISDARCLSEHVPTEFKDGEWKMVNDSSDEEEEVEELKEVESSLKAYREKEKIHGRRHRRSQAKVEDPSSISPTSTNAYNVVETPLSPCALSRSLSHQLSVFDSIC